MNNIAKNGMVAVNAANGANVEVLGVEAAQRNGGKMVKCLETRIALRVPRNVSSRHWDLS